MSGQKTYVIAEAGVNHNGSLGLAKQLVDVAARAGADAVKFQTFIAEALVTKSAAKAEYQASNTGNRESQFEMLKKLELNNEQHHALAKHCERQGIHFLSTPFDLDSLAFLVRELNLSRIKLGSGEVTNGPLLLAAARSGKPVILSTGMSTMDEVKMALSILAFGYFGKSAAPSKKLFEEVYRSAAAVLREKVTLLHCTTEYPAPFCDVNLFAMDTMAKELGVPVGISDHTLGIAVPLAAVARGAVIIEKHFTLDKSLPGPDHKASLSLDELSEMVRSIRAIEEALGSAQKAPSAGEARIAPGVRRSLVAKQQIRKGEVFTEENLTAKRPGFGISPVHYWDWLGRVADRDYPVDGLIEEPSE